MVRKLFFMLTGIAVLLSAVFALLFFCNRDLITERFAEYVCNTTGAPLQLKSKPVITFFPNRGLELDAGSWQKKDGSLAIRFSKASVQISSHELFFGRFSVKRLSIEGLDVQIRLKKSLGTILRETAETSSRDFSISDINQFLVQALGVAPDAVSIEKGRLRFIQPDGSSIVMAPFTLTADSIQPDRQAPLCFHTAIKGSAPAFSAAVDLRCTVLFNEEKASLAFTKAVFTPRKGLPFNEAASISGKIDYSFTTGRVGLSQVKCRLPGASLSISGVLDSIAPLVKKPLETKANFKLEGEFSIPVICKALGLRSPFVPHAMESCKASMLMHMDGTNLTLSPFSFSTDGIDVKGDLATSLKPLAVSGSIELGDIDISRRLWMANAAVTADGSEKDYSLWPKLDIKLHASSLSSKGRAFKNVGTALKGKGGIYEFNPLSGTFLESPVIASLKTVLTPGDPFSALCSLNLNMSAVDLSAFSTLIAEAPILSGTGSLNASLQFDESKGVPSIAGTFSMTASPVETTRSLMPGTDFEKPSEGKRDVFEQFFLRGSLKDGKMTVDHGDLSSPRLTLKTNGTADLASGALQGRGMLIVAGSSYFPVRIEGTLSNPSYSLVGSEKTKPAFTPQDVKLNLSLPMKIDSLLNPKK